MTIDTITPQINVLNSQIALWQNQFGTLDATAANKVTQIGLQTTNQKNGLLSQIANAQAQVANLQAQLAAMDTPAPDSAP